MSSALFHSKKFSPKELPPKELSPREFSPKKLSPAFSQKVRCVGHYASAADAAVGLRSHPGVGALSAAHMVPPKLS